MLPLLMAGISAATSIAGSIINSRGANEAAKKQQAAIDREREQNESWYNRRYFEDGTQRADVQRVLTRAQEDLRRNNQAVSGAAAVMGGTNATAAAAKEANNQAYADMVGQAAATADARKDGVESTYMKQRSDINQQQAQLDATRAEAKQKAVTDAVQGVGNVATAVIGAADQNGGVKKQEAAAPSGPVGSSSPGVVGGRATLDGKINAKSSYPSTQSSFDTWLSRQNGSKNKLV